MNHKPNFLIYYENKYTAKKNHYVFKKMLVPLSHSVYKETVKNSQKLSKTVRNGLFLPVFFFLFLTFFDHF